MTDLKALDFARKELNRMQRANKRPTWMVRNITSYNEDCTTSSKEGALNLIKSRLLSGNKRVCHLAKYNPKREYTEDDPYVNVERWELVDGVPKKVGVR